jgi:putative ABC transport system permease protein
MRLFQYLPVALSSISAHKLRAILTMLGIIIGVTAVLTTMGIGRGAAANITQRIESQGTNLLIVYPGATTSGGMRTAMGSSSTLTMGDVAALRDAQLHPSLALIAPEYSSNAQLVYGGTNSNNSVVGTTTDYASIRNFTIASGRFLTADDTEQQNRVVVLGSDVTSDLFGTQDPLGQTVRIDGEPFQVVGVLTEVGGFGPNSTDTQAFVPIGVAQGRLFSASHYRGEYTVTGISIGAASSDRTGAAKLEIERTLRLRHNLRADQDNDFRIFDQASLLETVADVSQTMTIFLGAIGAVSLVVGGIGIMNIMLVSVTERTREIGLRKAVGAQDSDILFQFLVEALVLCFMGGIIGVGLAYGVAFLFGQLPASTFNVVITADSLALALSFSLLSGLIFGIYPAMRATQLDPIEALRSE